MRNETIPRIRCTKCNKIVDTVMWWEEMATKERVLLVKCHGDEDRMEFNPMLLTEAQRMEIQYGEGLAFATERLESSYA